MGLYDRYIGAKHGSPVEIFHVPCDELPGIRNIAHGACSPVFVDISEMPFQDTYPGTEIRGGRIFAGCKFVFDSLKRHTRCDWGELSEQDKASNNSALNGSGRLFSAYIKEGLDKIWIITEWDRSVTTILFPDEY